MTAAGSVLADCEPCEGMGVKLRGEDCGSRCGECGGLGVVKRPITEEQADELVFGDLPAGWTKDHALALLSRIKTGVPVVLPEKIWSPYPDGRP